MLAGATVITRDVDITPAAAAENMERLATALAELNAAIRLPNEPPLPLPHDARLLATTQIWNLTTDAGDLDITMTPDGTQGYEDLLRDAQTYPLHGGMSIAIASLRDVIRSKTAADRAKDRAVLGQLRAMLDEHDEQSS